MPVNRQQHTRPYRVIIAGSREFNDKELATSVLDELLGSVSHNDIVILCGMARGADTIGMQWAQDRGYDVAFYPASWNILGKKAGYVRNKEMATDATHLVAFWDGKSKGTKNMISLGQEYNLEITVVRTDTNE